MGHNTRAICLCNMGTLRNKKSALRDMRFALCDMTVYFAV